MSRNDWMMAKYDAGNPAALKRLVAAGAQLRPFTPAVMEACFKAANEVYAEISATNADFKKVYDVDRRLPQRPVSVVAGRRIHLRHLHDPQRARAADRRSSVTTVNAPERSRCPGFFVLRAA